jgi:hypothetical protein
VQAVALAALWPGAFLLTIASELAVAVPLLGPSCPLARRAGAVLLGQCITHPLVWFAWPLLGLPRPLYLLCAEAFAVAAELVVYRLALAELAWPRAVAAASLANAASIAVGLLLRL